METSIVCKQDNINFQENVQVTLKRVIAPIFKARSTRRTPFAAAYKVIFNKEARYIDF